MSDDLVYLPMPDEKYLPFWHPPVRARCIKDRPPMKGFGRQLTVGDVVDVRGVCWEDEHYTLAVPSECAFYRMDGYFEVEPPTRGPDNAETD